MRIKKTDLELLAEIYSDIYNPTTREYAEDAEELHPLLAEMKGDIFLGVPWYEFITKATEALNQEYIPKRGRGLAWFLKKVGELMNVELEYQDQDGGYVIATDDYSTDEDAENMAPRKDLQPDGQKMTVGDIKPPVKKLK